MAAKTVTKMLHVIGNFWSCVRLAGKLGGFLWEIVL